jgi:PhnB protein
MNVQPYLFFNGRAEEALAFYTRAFDVRPGALMRYADAPEPPPPGMLPPGSENKVMHADFKVGDTTVMLSDGQCTGPVQFSGVSLAIACDSESAARRAFDALAAGGEVTVPLGKTFWSPCFGMLKDRFGLGWMVSLADNGGSR